MKMRIVQAGFEGFTGLLGDVKFEDGVSVKDVSAEQFAYVRAMFVVEQVEDEAQDQDKTEDEEVPSEEQKQDEKAPEAPEVPSEEQKNEAAE